MFDFLCLQARDRVTGVSSARQLAHWQSGRSTLSSSSSRQKWGLALLGIQDALRACLTSCLQCMQLVSSGSDGGGGKEMGTRGGTLSPGAAPSSKSAIKAVVIDQGYYGEERFVMHAHHLKETYGVHKELKLCLKAIWGPMRRSTALRMCVSGKLFFMWSAKGACTQRMSHEERKWQAASPKQDGEGGVAECKTSYVHLLQVNHFAVDGFVHEGGCVC
eukprot:1158158-Pelagomonas_calceolata.AAC.1